MHTVRNWIVENKQGRSLFYFRLYTISEISADLYFDSNILFRIADARLILLLEQLVFHKIPLDKKERIAQQLFMLIRENSYYEQFYFEDDVLDKYGKINFSAYECIRHLLMERLDDSCLLPLSANSYSYLFFAARKHFHLHRDTIFESSKQITQLEFENQLCTDALKFAYVEVFDKGNVFYLYTDNTNIVSYFIINGNDIIFLFEVEK